MKKKRYELVSGKSSKFWEIEVKGSSMTTVYGRIGTKGQRTVKKFPTAAAAKSAVEKLINEKIKKGYSAATPGNSQKKAITAPKSRASKKKVIKKTKVTQVNLDTLSEAEGLNLAKAKDTSKSVLTKLIGYKQQIDLAIAEREDLPADLAKSLSQARNSYVRLAVAQNPKTPVAVLEKLAKDKGKGYFIHDAVAKNTKCPITLLKTLAKDRDWSVREAVAESVKCPLTILKALALDKTGFVRSAAYANSKWPASTLTRLAENDDSDIRCGVAGNPNTPASALKKLTRDPDSDVVCSAAANPSCPSDVLEHLISSKNSDIRESLARNPKLPIRLIRKLAGAKDWDTLRILATNPNCPAGLRSSVWRKLAANKETFLRSSVATDPTTPPMALEILARDKSLQVRSDIASNPSCSARALTILAGDKNKEIRMSVAERPDLPLSAFRELASARDKYIRWRVANNSNCPESVLKKLASDKDFSTRILVARNPNYPSELSFLLYEELARAKSSYSRREVAQSSNCPPTILKKIAKETPSEEWELNLELIENPSTPIDVVENLRQNPNRYLSRLATRVFKKRRLAE